MQSFTQFIAEASKANKFNIHWQIVRTQARDIKDPSKKLHHVMSYLNAHKNQHNYGRVLNWVKMTGVAYKGGDRSMFENAAKALEKRAHEFTSTEDTANDLSKISTDDLKKVHKDLSKRKYGFQYKSVPKAHTDFMSQLQGELDKR